MRDGDWTAVVLNSDASPGLTVRAGELLAAGVLLGVAAVVLMVVLVRLASRPER